MQGRIKGGEKADLELGGPFLGEEFVVETGSKRPTSLRMDLPGEASKIHTNGGARYG